MTNEDNENPLRGTLSSGLALAAAKERAIYKGQYTHGSGSAQTGTHACDSQAVHMMLGTARPAGLQVVAADTNRTSYRYIKDFLVVDLASAIL
jgi:hypothetical protein